MNLNNPGNIRASNDHFQGEVRPSSSGGFKQFVSQAYGYRAMFVILANYLKKGYDTVFKIVSRWAPPFENNTADYILFVSDKMKVGQDAVISEKQLPQLVYFMAYFENGFPPDREEIDKGYRLFRQSRGEPEPIANRLKTGTLLLGLSMVFFILKTRIWK